MPEGSAPASGESTSQKFLASTNRSADNLRATAKWVLTSFAAIGAVVAAGLSISNLGHLRNFPGDLFPLILAVVAIAVAYGAIGYAIKSTVRVLVTEQFMTLRGLEDEDRQGNLPEQQKTFIEQSYLLADYTQRVRSRYQKTA